jgi:hypothetical protein
MMDDLRLSAVVARVVDWHTRHPLARRVSVAHGRAVDRVGLPFVGAVGATVATVAASALALAAGATPAEHPAAPPPALAKALSKSLAVPSIRPVISDEEKARARQAREALGVPRPTAAPAPPETATVTATSPQAAQPPEPASAAAAFALTTRLLRTRAEAEQVQVAMRSLLKTIGAAGVKVDVLPLGDDWRVVALPFPQRAAVDKARVLLVSRGMRVEVVDF